MDPVSLVISTYNWKEALALSIGSALAQSVRPAEILIADDGSREDTRQLVESLAASSPVPIRHVWHPDEGFRLAAIRNKAFAQASSPYIIQTDGDIIMHRHFIADHLRLRRKGFFLNGSRVLLGPQLSSQLLAGVADPSALSPFSAGITNRLNAIHSRWLSARMAAPKRTFLVRGCNMSFWKEDLLAVNGYNEDIKGWGREDSELAVRLLNHGLKVLPAKFSAIAFHLYHQEASRSHLAANDAILEQALAAGTKLCQNGIRKL